MRNKKILVLLISMIIPLSGLLIFPASDVGEKFIPINLIFNHEFKEFEKSYSALSYISIGREFNAMNDFSATMSEIPFEWYTCLSHNPIRENEVDALSEDTLDWGVDDIDAEKVWGGSEDAFDVISGNFAGQEIKICVADTGIDYTHPDLDDNYVSGYDFYDNDPDPMDFYNHGTHCAGIIGAEDNGEGVIGVAPKVSLYAAKVLSDGGSGQPENLAAGIDWAVQNDMDVVSMSLGWSISTNSECDAAIERAWDAGVILVAATHNHGSSAITYPANHEKVIAVGATDSNRLRASFSNFGPELDVVAPGVDVYSTVIGGNYQTMSGTSMATPMVAGLCALILSKNPSLTNDEVRDIIRNTATDLGDSGRDDYYGNGLINTEAAIAATSGGGGGEIPPVNEMTSPNDLILVISIFCIFLLTVFGFIIKAKHGPNAKHSTKNKLMKYSEQNRYHSPYPIERSYRYPPHYKRQQNVQTRYERPRSESPRYGQSPRIQPYRMNTPMRASPRLDKIPPRIPRPIHSNNAKLKKKKDRRK